MNALYHSYLLALRHLRQLIRQPWWVAITLVQPIVWLLFYGQLFKRVVELPGFNSDSYITFVTPGVVVMSALFSGGWNGMGILFEIDLG
jgi:ABC-2 type transport system permease protein